MNIYVGSLHYDLGEAELKEVFEEFGEVSSVKIITDKFSGRSKGFGFVEMPDEDDAQKAIDSLNGSDVKGRSIVVNQAMERKERRSGSGGGGNFRGGDRRGGGGGPRRGGNYRND